MRRTWTTATVALSCAILCIAYPQPIDILQQQQQHTFTPAHHGHHNIHNNDNNINNNNEETIHTYARFDGEQVLRLDVSNLAQLKLLQATVEVSILGLCLSNIPSSLAPLFRHPYTHYPSPSLVSSFSPSLLDRLDSF
ncbi:hypothetical protein F5H01DRAFT_345821 [Linnemannia elongata]|nr:hypothetical protein F5H01DRAFT_345821 [Linnemannia elongata]